METVGIIVGVGVTVGVTEGTFGLKTIFGIGFEP